MTIWPNTLPMTTPTYLATALVLVEENESGNAGHHVSTLVHDDDRSGAQSTLHCHESVKIHEHISTYLPRQQWDGGAPRDDSLEVIPTTCTGGKCIVSLEGHQQMTWPTIGDSISEMIAPSSCILACNAPHGGHCGVSKARGWSRRNHIPPLLTGWLVKHIPALPGKALPGKAQHTARSHSTLTQQTMQCPCSVGHHTCRPYHRLL